MEDDEKALEARIAPPKVRKSILARVRDAVCMFLMRTAKGVRVRDSK